MMNEKMENKAIAAKVCGKLAEPDKHPKPETKVIIIRETTWESILSDCFTFGCPAALMLAGWFMGSSAMQWLGFLTFWVVAVAQAPSLRKSKMTIQEARLELDRLETEINHQKEKDTQT